MRWTTALIGMVVVRLSVGAAVSMLTIFLRFTLFLPLPPLDADALGVSDLGVLGLRPVLSLGVWEARFVLGVSVLSARFLVFFGGSVEKKCAITGFIICTFYLRVPFTGVPYGVPYGTRPIWPIL